jgi:CRISPR-associated endonuclease Csn1
MGKMGETGSLAQSYVLGIDLGSASLGWAAISLDETGKPSGLLRAGVRIFDPAVTGDTEKGQDESNAVARRTARLIRRQLRRRAARQSDLFGLLQRHSLLPPYEGAEADASQQRHSILNTLDKQLAARWESSGGQTAADLPLYLLRKAALDAALEPFELGRVFYHLSQRRGYRSNRKEQASKKDTPGKAKKEDDLGVVEGDIKNLLEEMSRAHARTLGEYFASLDPHTQKVRRRWTGRKMYEDEFAAIWASQAAFHPVLLTEELHREIKHLLFYQRPIKAQAHLIGGCELEEGERRAAWATLEAQQFRVLQKVNDLEMILPGQVNGIPLTAEQRQTVLDLLEHSETASFDKIRKALKLDKNIGFNLQRGGETKLKGNLTNTHMAAVFAERWPEMPDADKMQIVEDWRTIPQDDSLIRRAIEHWKLDEPGAKWLAGKAAPSGYCMYSRKAIRKLLPLMATGMRLKAAENEIPEYRNRLTGGQAHDRIPPVRDTLKTLRNPAVERALTELRKVVNALIREHGKPAEVRIELARDLKKPRHERARATTQNRDREKERETMRKRIAAEFGEGFRPSRADVEKALLFEECGGECPYSGKRFPFSSLFGENSPWQVEHIIPFSRMPDDSFQNKTLCEVHENQYKANRTPREAYTDPQQYEAICNRVRNWKKPNLGKLKRFELRTTEEIEGFSSRQLNDTRYASKLACELVGSLYGGRDVAAADGKSRQVVFASSGMVTATLRRGWGLEGILREIAPAADADKKGKPRTDHRHHAIDAITIALSRPKLIAALSRANERDPYWPKTGRRFPRIDAPWKDFVDSIRPQIEQMLVSHRPEHRLTGAMHDETNYGRPRKEGGKDVVHIRKAVAGLPAGAIESIVDSAVREAVRAKAAEFGGSLEKWTPNEGKEDWPLLKTKAGKFVPIKRVRISKALGVETIAQGGRARNVALSSNHHVAIFALLDERGREKRWDSIALSLFDAMERKRKGQPLIQTSYPDAGNYVFKFSLMGGDTVLLHKECNHKENLCNPSVWRLRTIASNGQLCLMRVNDARLIKAVKDAGDWWSPRVDALRKLDATKVVIDSLGRIHQAGG